MPKSSFACVMPGCKKPGPVVVIVPAHINSEWRFHYCEEDADRVIALDPARRREEVSN